jgi:hypothetical protein
MGAPKHLEAHKTPLPSAVTKAAFLNIDKYAGFREALYKISALAVTIWPGLPSSSKASSQARVSAIVSLDTGAPKMSTTGIFKGPPVGG